MTALEGRVRASTGEGLPGVLVSDGRAVRRTDANGDFGLDEARNGGSGFVFVTRPTGFATADWFYRVAGGTASYDFTLEPVEQPVPFVFAQVTDLHLCVEPEPATLPVPDSPYGLDAAGNGARRPVCTPGDVAALLEELSELRAPEGAPGGVAFVAATGDLTDRGVPAEYGALKEVLSASPVPVEVLPGNHDHYGHRHEPRPDDAPVDSFGMSTGTTTRYEEGVGPRWWSMDHGGVHFVALDWFSHRLGADRATQEVWLRADLAAQPGGTPVVLLVHDQMKRDFFGRLRRMAPHVRLLGSFSGHWHTCRTVTDGGEVHANTGNATFGSCDFTPPQYRLCTWDGERLSVRTTTRGGRIRLPEASTRATARPPARVSGEVWSARLPGAAHMARPVVAALRVNEGARETVFATWGNEEDPEGGVLALDAATGEETWRARVASTVRAGAAYAPGAGGSSGTVVFTSVSGEVLALDPLSGERLWHHQVGDPLHMWVYQEPLIHEDLVFVGDVVMFRALDLATGEAVWERGDLGRPENYVSVAHPAVQADNLLVGFMDQSPNTWGLNPRTGEPRWSSGEDPLPAPLAAFLPDPDGEHAYTVRFGGLMEKLRALSGERRWKARVDAIWTAGRPGLTPDGSGVIATSGAGTVYCLDRATGALIWRTELPEEALLAMGPYRKGGPVVVSGPTVTGRGILQGTCGGTIYRLDPSSGEAAVVARLDAPVAVPLAPVGEHIVVVTTDGTVRRLRVT